jgi:hypothetical protein
MSLPNASVLAISQRGREVPRNARTHVHCCAGELATLKIDHGQSHERKCAREQPPRVRRSRRHPYIFARGVQEIAEAGLKNLGGNPQSKAKAFLLVTW